MVKIIRRGVYYTEGRIVKEAQAFMTSEKKQRALAHTMSAQVEGAAEFGNFPPFSSTRSQFARERAAASGKRIAVMGCGALGALSGDGESEGTVAVYLRGKLQKAADAVDVVLSILRVHKGFLKGKTLEFMGAGLHNLSMEERIALDEGMRHTGCAATVFETDEKTREYFAVHDRAKDVSPFAPQDPAYYDGAVIVDLTRIVPMIGLPAGEIYSVEEIEPTLIPFENFDCAVLKNCGYETIATLSELKNEGMGSILCEVNSLPVMACLAKNGYLSEFFAAGGILFPPDALREEGTLYSDGFHDGAAYVSPKTAAASVAAGKLTTFGGRTKRMKKYEFDLSVYRSAESK